MTTTVTGLPPMRPFTPQECEALVSFGIIAEGEQADVLAGIRLFNVDEYLDAAGPGPNGRSRLAAFPRRPVPSNQCRYRKPVPRPVL